MGFKEATIPEGTLGASGVQGSHRGLHICLLREFLACDILPECSCT